MIKYLLGAILALAVIGGAFKFESNETSWHLIILKKEALNSVTNGGKRIFNIFQNLISSDDFAETSSLIIEED